MNRMWLITLLFLSACREYPVQDGGYVVPYDKYYKATNNYSVIPGIHKSKTLQEVNNRVNNYVKYKYNPADKHWQTPYETIKKRTGKCIDYAILKRHIIIQLGLAHKEDLYIILIYDKKKNIDHAVLMINHIILDSQINKLYNLNSKTFKDRYIMRVVVKQ